MSKAMDKKTVVILCVVLALGIAAATPRFLDAVTAFGHHIPQQDLATDYLKASLWALGIGVSIFFWPVCGEDKKCLLLGWLGKVVVTLGVMLFYEGHYGLDAYMYFDESQRTSFSFAAIANTGFASGTKNIINLAALNNLLVPNSYHAQKVSFALLGLIGIYLFYRTAVCFLGRGDSRLFYILAFFPGILFWSSILGKEPVVFFAISLYVYGTVSWQLYGRYRSFLPIAAGIVIGTVIRAWLGPIMVVPLVLLFLCSPSSKGAKLALLLVSAVVLVLSLGPMLERFKIQAFEDVLTAADKTTQGFVRTAGGSTQDVQVDLTSPAEAAKFLPQAAFTALFRPLPGEVMNPFGLLAGVESALLLGLLLVALRRTSLRELREPLVIWAASFITVWALVNGIVSSTNFGVGVRYKLQVLPLLLGLLAYLARDRNKELPAAGPSKPSLAGAVAVGRVDASGGLA